jgi:hypothetical protein
VWCHKAHPTFSDALALVRRDLWAQEGQTFWGVASGDGHSKSSPGVRGKPDRNARTTQLKRRLLDTLVSLGPSTSPGGRSFDQSLLRLGCRQTVVKNTISKFNPRDLLTFFPANELKKRADERTRTADLISLRVIIRALRSIVPSVASAWRQVRNLRTPFPTLCSPLFAWVVVNCCQEYDRNYRPSGAKAVRCFILPILICTSDRLRLSATLTRLEARWRSNSSVFEETGAYLVR